jgi:hypothetical protein
MEFTKLSVGDRYFLGGCVLLAATYIYYILSIWKGKNPPANPFSWMVFSAISFGTAIVLPEEVTLQIRLFPVMMAIFQLIIAGVSYSKNNEGTLERGDRIGLLIGLSGVVFWVSSSVGMISSPKWVPISAVLFADAVGFYPTIRDAWRKPNKEDIPVWGVFSIAGGLILVGVFLSGKKGFNFLYPAYEAALAISTMLVLLVRSR